VYITDAPADINLLSSLEVTLYSIDLCRDTACNDTVNVFSSNTGVTIDLTNLEGVLHYIDTAQVPQEQFQAMKIEVAQSETVVYEGIAGSFSLQSGENVSCDDTAQRCSVVVTGAINPAINNKLLVDFDLKNFQLDCNVDQTNNTVSCTVTSMAVVARPETPQNITNRFKFEMYAIIDPQQINAQNQFSFQWRNKTYTAQIGDNTICEIKDMNYIGADCISQLQQFNTPVCLELKLVGDPAQADIIQDVVKFEVKSPKKCGYEMEVEYDDDYYEYGIYKREMKGMFNGINGDYITVGNMEFKITDTTYCEIDTEGEEDRHYVGIDCLNTIQNMPMSSAPYVEVKYVEQNGEYIALKVDIEYEE